ncbi:tetratricopeptide repeat protein [Nostoc sp. DedQUE09]|uniref:tetratricopeptide repeat protein n=1 Tax=Nostoc sp. DedQUE09 TaxID=3075394 RepID=UPI002AD3E2C8|nr:tetratricopeptide repeat protein [Nostoc sp. DedQUE09]MDZ7955317.1 tetratricopeptide repeat protein [Nostoc sp. DedQUE09]
MKIQLAYEKDPRVVATIINRIAGTYIRKGDRQKALDSLNQALSLQQQVADNTGKVTTLRNLAVLYNLPKGEAIAYNLIGFIYMKQKLYQKAIDAFEQALPLIQKARFPSIEDKAISSIDTLQIGTNTLLAGEDSFALLPGWLQSHIPFGSNKFNELSEKLSRQRTARLREAANEIETFNRIRDKVKDFNLVTEVPIMRGLGQSYDAVKQYSKAISNYNSALTLAKKYGDHFREAETNYLMAVTEQKRGNFKAARAKIEAALNVVEDFCSKVVDPQLRSSYFASVQEYYEFYIDLLMQLHKQQPSQGFNALALQASERARARSLLDLLNESLTEIRQGVDPKLLEQEENLQFKLNALEKSRIELYSKTPTEAQKASFEKEYDTLFSQYRNIETQIRSKSPRYAALAQPKPLTLTELQQQVLDDNTVLLEYFLGTKHSYLWAVSKSENN